MKIKHIFLGLLNAVFISCSGDDDSTSPIPETAPQLIVKFKFDASQERLGNLGTPVTIPSGTGVNNEDKVNPFKETPALAKANIGIITNATYGDNPCSNFNNRDCF